MTADREMMLMSYGSHPELLAMDLEVLLEPCTDHGSAVLQHAAVQKIITLCARHRVEKDEQGTTKREIVDFWCKRKLADTLARAVLRHARMQ